MIITCGECNTSFNLDESFIKPSGSKVRCSVCKNIFTANPLLPPDDADVEEVLKRVRENRENYLRWGRETFGWAIYLFKKEVIKR